jgi:dipeptidyl aminopeptidase/acylaminoacyl peptidase
MFSSDIPFESMQANFGQVMTPLIMVHSGKDEYIPSHINKEQLISDLTNASPSSLGAVVLPDADHAISDLASQTIFCNAVVQFIRKVLITLEQEEKAQEQALGGLSL